MSRRRSCSFVLGAVVRLGARNLKTEISKDRHSIIRTAYRRARRLPLGTEVTLEWVRAK